MKQSCALVKEIESLGGQVITNAKVTGLIEGNQWTAETGGRL